MRMGQNQAERLVRATDSGSAAFSIHDSADGFVVAVSGLWTHATVNAVSAGLDRLIPPPRPEKPAIIDLARLTGMDTAGAFILRRAAGRLAAQFRGARPAVRLLLDMIPDPAPKKLQQKYPAMSFPELLFGRIGNFCLSAVRAGAADLDALGQSLVAIAKTLRRPGSLRFVSLMVCIQRTGMDALPIVCLLTFLIGIVIAQQGAVQLGSFGAEIFTINMLGLLFLREIGILLTAVIVAGRSGSAFAAEIGTMKVNQEIDAIHVLGLDPVAVLVVPRVIALIIVLPLLTFFADVMGLLGGAVAVWVILEVPPTVFAERLHDAVTLATFTVAFIKAPFMALVIAVIGCASGMRVSGSAESVGKMTTAAVVKAIFAVIVLDAVFSVFFTAIGV